MRRLLCSLLLLLLTTACTSSPDPDVGATEAATATATADPTPSPTPTPTPTPTATPTPPPLPPAQPFTVAVTEVRVANGSNAALYGAPPPPPDPTAANQAVDAAAASLQAFLNAQFVAPDTRFSDAGVAALLDPATISPETRAALGVLDGVAVEGTVTGSVTATADVIVEGTAVHAVTLTYASTVDLVLAAGSGPVSHVGVVTYVPLGEGMVLAAVQPTTTFGGDLQVVLS